MAFLPIAPEGEKDVHLNHNDALEMAKVLAQVSLYKAKNQKKSSIFSNRDFATI
jgi:hypothetical protein